LASSAPYADLAKIPKVMDMAFNAPHQAWNQRTFLEEDTLGYKRATWDAIGASVRT